MVSRASGKTERAWEVIHRQNPELETLDPIPPRLGFMWVVIKIVVPLWIPTIIRHLIFRVPKKGP